MCFERGLLAQTVPLPLSISASGVEYPFARIRAHKGPAFGHVRILLYVVAAVQLTLGLVLNSAIYESFPGRHAWGRQRREEVNVGSSQGVYWWWALDPFSNLLYSLPCYTMHHFVRIRPLRALSFQEKWEKSNCSALRYLCACLQYVGDWPGPRTSRTRRAGPPGAW